MQATGLYNDFGTLASLRTEARADAAATLDEVARQFESLFVQMMLKSMRDATMKGGLFDSHQLETYEQMYDQQLSLDLARQGGVGLADVIVRQLSGQADAAGVADTAPGVRDPLLPDVNRGHAPRAGLPAAAVQSTPAAASATAGDSLDAYRARALPRGVTPVANGQRGERTPQAAGPPAEPLASTPAEFLQELRPLAVDAAHELGVDPAVLLAQAALETGWGRRVIADQRGSSNNLFNIKAGPDWSGPSVTVATIEYRDGVAVREGAAFRAYATPAESFSDYVGFLRDNPRYAAALEAAGDGAAYLRALQAAGYATDPAYADKILAILERDELFGGGALAATDGGLKKAAALPLKG
jgi:flagellar protein FlgJ